MSIDDRMEKPYRPASLGSPLANLGLNVQAFRKMLVFRDDGRGAARSQARVNPVATSDAWTWRRCGNRWQSVSQRL